ncbi:hypothetical protein Tco_1548148 [Tanacetum coccineum]
MAYPRQDFTRKRVLTNSQYDVSFLSTYTISVKITIRRYTKSSKLGMISLIDYKHSTYSKESNPIRRIDLARYGTNFRREDQPSRSIIDHESIEDIVKPIDKETSMAEPNDYITATQKKFLSNDNEGRMVEICIVEIQGTFLEPQVNGLQRSV